MLARVIGPGSPAMDQDWGLLTTFLPSGWKGLAESTGALKGLRKDRSAVALMKRLRKSKA